MSSKRNVIFCDEINDKKKLMSYEEVSLSEIRRLTKVENENNLIIEIFDEDHQDYFAIDCMDTELAPYRNQTMIRIRAREKNLNSTNNSSSLSLNLSESIISESPSSAIKCHSSPAFLSPPINKNPLKTSTPYTTTPKIATYIPEKTSKRKLLGSLLDYNYNENSIEPKRQKMLYTNFILETKQIKFYKHLDSQLTQKEELDSKSKRNLTTCILDELEDLKYKSK